MNEVDSTADHGAGTPGVNEVVGDEFDIVWNEVNEDQPMAGKKAQTSAEAALIKLIIFIHTSVVEPRVTSRKGTRFANQQVGVHFDAESRKNIGDMS